MLPEQYEIPIWVGIIGHQDPFSIVRDDDHAAKLQVVGAGAVIAYSNTNRP